jgi:hypothetical protein
MSSSDKVQSGDRYECAVRVAFFLSSHSAYVTHDLKAILVYPFDAHLCGLFIIRFVGLRTMLLQLLRK